jgi:hypothetical protein
MSYTTSLKRGVVVAVIIASCMVASAKSNSWSSGVVTTMLMYFWNNGAGCLPGTCGGWAPGLKNFNVSVTYEASMYRNGTIIPDLTSVAVGDVISFTAPLSATDISWNGTGYSSDSPYGHWIADAAAPAAVDLSSDLVSTFPFSLNYMSIYVPLSVNPPTITYTHTGSTASLDCNGDTVADTTPVGSSCTVLSSGTVLTQVRYASTYGKFYYKYLLRDSEGNQTGLNYFTGVPLRLPAPGNNCYDIGGGSYIYVCIGDSSDYILTVPEQTISFSVNTDTTPTVFLQFSILDRVQEISQQMILAISDFFKTSVAQKAFAKE